MQCNRPYDGTSVSSTVPSSAAEVSSRQVRAGTGEAEPAGVPEQEEEPGPGMPPERVTELAEAVSGTEAAEWSGSPNAERNDEPSPTGANFSSGCAVCPPLTSRKHRSPKCGVCSTANGFPPYGIKAICGRRPRMEDAYKAVPFLMDVVVPGFFSDILPPRIANHVKNHVKSASNSPESESGSDNEELPAGRHLAPYTETLHFFGVFDGHGGAEAALHCAQTLHQRIREALVAAPAAAAAAGPEDGLEGGLPRTSSSPHPIKPVSSDIGVGAALALSIAEHLSQEVPLPQFGTQVSTEPAKELRLSADPGPASSPVLLSEAQDRSAGAASGPELSIPTADQGSMTMAPVRDPPGPASGENPQAATDLPDLPAISPAWQSGRASIALTGERRSAFAAPGLASGDASAAPGPRFQQGDVACHSKFAGLIPRHEEAVLASEQASEGATTGTAHGDAALQGSSAAPHPGAHRADGGFEATPAVHGHEVQLPCVPPQETMLGARTGHDMPQEASSPKFEASESSSERTASPGPASAAVVGCGDGSTAHLPSSGVPAKVIEPRALGGDVPGRKVHLLLNGSREIGASPDNAGQGQGFLPVDGEGSDGESPQSEDGNVALQDSSSEESPSASVETAEDDQWTFTAEKFEIAFLEAFCRTDEEFAKADNAALVGTTAVVALVGTRQLYVANCGDSRAVLCRGGMGVALTDDHKAAREDETARVEAAGGQILFWNGVRVMGVLAVSRAIGDHCLRPFVIARPEVTILARRPDDELLLLASDGLWDVLSNQEACTLAKRCLRRARQRGASRESAARIAATVLTRAAVDRGSRDNVTVVVVDLSSGTTETEGFVGHPSNSDASMDPADEAVPGTLDSLPDGLSICNPRAASSMDNTDGAREVHGLAQADKLPERPPGEELLEEDPADKAAGLPVERGKEGPLAETRPQACPGEQLLPEDAVMRGQVPVDGMAIAVANPLDNLDEEQGLECFHGDKVPPSSLPGKPLDGEVAGTLSRDITVDALPGSAHLPHDEVPAVEGCETPKACAVEKLRGCRVADELPQQTPGEEAGGQTSKLPEDQAVHNAAEHPASLSRKGLPVGGLAAHPDTTGTPVAENGRMVAPLQAMSRNACGADDASGCALVEDNPCGTSMDMLPTCRPIVNTPGQPDMPDVGPAHDLPQSVAANNLLQSPCVDTTHAGSVMEERPEESPLDQLPQPPRMNSMPGGSPMVALPVSGGLESFGAVAG